MQEAAKVKDFEKVPISRDGRMNELMDLPLAQKATFLPEVGGMFRIGPFVFRVSVVNASQLRFTANLHDVIIEGLND